MLVLMGRWRRGAIFSQIRFSFICRAESDKNYRHHSSKYSSCLHSQHRASSQGDAEAGDWQQLQSGHPSTQRSDNGLITVNQRPSYSDWDEKVGRGGRGGERLVLSHYSPCHYHVWRLASNIEDRERATLLSGCRNLAQWHEVTNSSTNFPKYCLK